MLKKDLLIKTYARLKWKARNVVSDEGASEMRTCNEKRDQCPKKNQCSRSKKSKNIFIVKPLNLPDARYLV
jgi:hypothetical protein